MKLSRQNLMAQSINKDPSGKVNERPMMMMIMARKQITW